MRIARIVAVIRRRTIGKFGGFRAADQSGVLRKAERALGEKQEECA